VQGLAKALRWLDWSALTALDVQGSDDASGRILASYLAHRLTAERLKRGALAIGKGAATRVKAP
jgi:hypothetical protein